MFRAKHLFLGGIVAVVTLSSLSFGAHANSLQVWSNSWCTANSTWAGMVGLNNDFPTDATVSSVSVSNGVMISNITVGTILGSFAKGNIEGTATNLPVSLPSFTVTVGLNIANTDPVSRTITVSRPAACTPIETTTTMMETTTTTPVHATSEVPTSTTVAPTTKTDPARTTVPTVLESTVTTSTVQRTTVPGTTTTLPKTGRSSRTISGLATLLVSGGICLVALDRISIRPNRR